MPVSSYVGDSPSDNQNPLFDRGELVEFVNNNGRVGPVILLYSPTEGVVVHTHDGNQSSFASHWTIKSHDKYRPFESSVTLASIG